MQIRDLEYKTALDRATIRYYEKEGLIAPIRQENGYRIYTEDHLSQLLKIKLLRRLGMSIETIRELQRGTGDFDAAIRKQITALEAQINKAERAKAVCMQMRDDKANYITLNAEHYLNLLAHKEEKRYLKDFAEDVPMPFHPWRRYFARAFDYAWIEILVCVLLSVILRVRPFINGWIPFFIGFILHFLAVPLLAAMVHFWGTTPGKWLFCLSVVSIDGDKMDYTTALEREWEVLKCGYGFGLPVYCVVRMLISRHIYSEESLDWDDYVEYRYHDWKAGKTTFIISAVIILLISNILISADGFTPRHKGSLTTVEFSENYNFYAKICGLSEVKMREDGKFVDNDQYGSVIYVGAQPENKRHSFEYSCSNGLIKKICYQNKWSNVTIIQPVNEYCRVAAITAIMSQKGSGIKDIKQFSNIWDQTNKCMDGHIYYKNVTVSWTIQSQDCEIVTSGIDEYFLAKTSRTEDLYPAVSVDFAIDISE